jgi:threonine/homoserine/homoserine lactone efflux protein
MINSILVQGLLIGFSTAMPVGTIGILCIRQTLAGGFLYGVVSGLGSATADAFYSAIAASGLSLVQQFLLQHQIGLQILSGLLFCTVGYKIFWMAPAGLPFGRSLEPGKSTLLKQYCSILLLTLADPLPILFFTVLWAGSGEAHSHPLSAIEMGLGVFSGAMLWWIILSSVCHVCRSQFNAFKMRWLNRLSGGAIAGLGMVMMGKSIVMM